MRWEEEQILERLRRIEERIDALFLLCEEILEDIPSGCYTAPAGFSFVANQGQ